MINCNLCITKVKLLFNNQRNDIALITIYDLNKEKKNIWYVVALLESKIATFVIFWQGKAT